MNDPELLRQRRVAEETQEDPKPLYRYRVAAIRAGAVVPCRSGDSVKLDGVEGLVLDVDDRIDGPNQVSVKFDDSIERVDDWELRIVSPHRPAVLLGEADLLKRVAEDVSDAHHGRALETLAELARRKMKEGIDTAVDLLPQVAQGPDAELRRVLTKILRSRPFGDLEVALLQRKTDPAQADLVELPALAAAAPGETEANEVLDRLQSMDEEQAAQVAIMCGKNLVGAGGPGFVSGDVRERVATLSREHPSRDVRVALFVHAVPALQAIDDLIEKALPSDNPRVRGAAARELIRRGKTETVIEFAREEADADILVSLLKLKKNAVRFPVDLLERFLQLGKKHPKLEEATLLRLAEVGDAAAGTTLLAPWLEKGRKTGMGAALWCAGMLGQAESGDAVTKQLTKLKDLPQIGLAIEALARLGHASAGPALNAWGTQLLTLGSWGEELVDLCGLLTGHKVDPRELLGRFLVAQPLGASRSARALEAARVVHSIDPAQATVARQLLPTRFARFTALSEALAG